MRRYLLSGLGLLLCGVAASWAGDDKAVAPATQPAPARTEPSLTDAEKQKLQKLIGDLESDDPKTLDEAFQGLIQMGPKAAGALDVLAGMLADDRKITYRNHNYRMRDRTFQVNISAVGVLGRIGKPAVPALLVALENKDSMVRQLAAGSLASIDQPIEPKHWIRALADSNPYVQIYAARQLGKVKDAPAVEALCKALKDDDMDVQVEAAKALGRIGDKKAIDPLIDALPDAKLNVGWAAGRALGRIGLPAVQALLDRFESLDDRARLAGATAIWEADPKQMKEPLLQWLKSKHWEVRNAATHALAELKTPEAIQVVEGMVEDPNWNVRWTATRCLGEMADTETAGKIRAVLLKILKHDKEPKVRDRALWSLYFLPDKPPEDFWKAIKAAMADESPRVREAAATAAGKFWNPELAPELMQLIKDPEPRVRAEAALMLGGRNVEGALLELIRLLEDKDFRCAERAAFALGNEGTDKAVEALIEKVQDSQLDPKRRNAAVYGLSLSKNRKAIGPLIAALEDKALRRNSIRMRATLKELTGQDFRHDVTKWRKWYEQRKDQESDK